jgi:hypothetical protein
MDVMELRKALFSIWRKINGPAAERALQMSSLLFDINKPVIARPTEALNVYQVKEVEGRMQRERQVLTHQRRSVRPALNKLVSILALVLSVVWCAHGSAN